MIVFYYLQLTHCVTQGTTGKSLNVDILVNGCCKALFLGLQASYSILESKAGRHNRFEKKYVLKQD